MNWSDRVKILLRGWIKGYKRLHMADEILTDLWNLADGWCERRALNPLGRLLAAYPPPNGFTDEWNQLYDALRDIRALCRDQLTDEEKKTLNNVIVAIQKMLDR